MGKPLLTTKQVGNILGISPRRVRALIKAGRLPALLLEGCRDHLIDPQELHEFKRWPSGRPKKSA